MFYHLELGDIVYMLPIAQPRVVFEKQNVKYLNLSSLEAMPLQANRQ